MDLDLLLGQLARRFGTEGDAAAPERRARMRLRGALLDPGRRGARALALAAVIAVAATALWVILDAPAGGTQPLERGASAQLSSPVQSPGAQSPAAQGSAASAGTGSASTAPDTSGFGAAQVVVDVAGMVTAPGVYALPAGSRVIDALTAAGGALPGADLSNLNLARRLSDGEQIAVGVTGAPDHAGSATSGASTGGASPGAPVNLNSASVRELDGLPGIGPVLAQRIVDWRAAHGRFATVDQLGEVPGIGSATFGRLAPLVRV